MTKLSLETFGETISFETPEDDVTTKDLVEAFYQVMLGSTFGAECIINSMKEFIKEREY
jgi:hypothetical protein